MGRMYVYGIHNVICQHNWQIILYVVIHDCNIKLPYMHGLHREAKLHGSKILPEALPESSQIATVQCNSNGGRVSIIVEQV